jgi:CubicO group peptidase (beta-lactamase class C family)
MCSFDEHIISKNKIMQKSFLILFIFLISFIDGFSQNKNQEAEAILTDLITRDITTGAVAGYSVGGKTIWKSAVGYADKKSNTKFTSTTITRIASITKLFTAIGVMQLAEQNLVNIDEPIQKYVSNFPKKKKGTITVRHLLEHTSGISGYKNNKERESKKEYPRMVDAMNVFKNRKLKFKPGTDYSYTTYGYVVLGVLIENVTGKTYEEYIQKNVLDKAGMKNTKLEKFGVHVENKSSLYSKRKSEIKEVATNNLSNRIPAGGYYSTIDDLLAFGNAIINNKLVKESTLTLMTQNNGLKKEGNPHAIGWFMYGGKQNPSGAIGHSGGQSGVSAQIIIIPGTKTVSVALANTSRVWGDVFGVCAKLIGVSKKSE